jgi:poly-gamma-glutamate synthesis protein (capsule biosynthesis protein)
MVCFAMDNQLNWKGGTWVKEKPRVAEHEICITGDWAPIRAFSRMIDDDPEAVYGNVLGELRRCDLRLTNLECPLTGCNDPVSKSGSVFKGAPAQVRGLTCVPFDGVTLANNHVFDFGLEGFKETLNVLRGNGIKSLGAGLTRTAATAPLIVTLGETTIALVNFSEGEDLTGAVSGCGVFGWEVETVLDTVEACKAEADLVFVICHAGVEYIPFPPPYLVKALQRIARSGADLIVGHHPHVPQGIQIVENVPIVYSLGNFVFYQPTHIFCRKTGFFLKAGVSAGALTGIRLVPYRIGEAGLTLLEGEARLRFWNKMQQISQPLETMQGVDDAWHGFLRFYGIEGFFDEAGMIMDTFREKPGKGAAMMRNRLATMQHREHWIDAMTRVVDGTIDQSPDWAYDLVAEWMTKKI